MFAVLQRAGMDDNVQATIASFQSGQDSAALAQTSRASRNTACVPDPVQRIYSRPPRMPQFDCDRAIFRHGTPLAGCCTEEDWIAMHNLFVIWHMRAVAEQPITGICTTELKDIKVFLLAAFMSRQQEEDGMYTYRLPVPPQDANSAVIEIQTHTRSMESVEPILFLSGFSRPSGLTRALRGAELFRIRVYIGRTYAAGVTDSNTRLYAKLRRSCQVLQLVPYNTQHYRLPHFAANGSAALHTGHLEVTGEAESSVELTSLKMITVASVLIESPLTFHAGTSTVSDWWYRLLLRTGGRLRRTHNAEVKCSIVVIGAAPSTDSLSLLTLLQGYFAFLQTLPQAVITFQATEDDYLSMIASMALGRDQPEQMRRLFPACVITVELTSDRNSYLEVRIKRFTAPEQL